VRGYFFHLKGSIDEYQGQLNSWKEMASNAGLDFGDQPADDEFVHFNAFFEKFIRSTDELEQLLKTKRAA
jgi:hypothetical protein